MHVFVFKTPPTFVGGVARGQTTRENSYGRTALQAVLEQYGRRSQLKLSRYGKPLTTDWHASISYSSRFTFVALAKMGPIGIDAEDIGQKIELSIADAFANEEEQKAILTHDNPKRALIQLWTLKEAYIKCVGLGLRLPLKTITTSADLRHISSTAVSVNAELHLHVARFQNAAVAACSYTAFPPPTFSYYTSIDQLDCKLPKIE